MARACPITVLPCSAGPVPTASRPATEQHAMPMLADIVEVVIGVDTHKHTHTAAIVQAATGTQLAAATVPATAAGYQNLLAWAADHGQPNQRAWAIEGTGGYGAGLTRLLVSHGEQVIELDRPKRPARRHGARSDDLDAVRAARDALARTHLGQPRSSGQRAALAVLLGTRRAAVGAATDAQRQLHALVVASPERLRDRLRGLSTNQLLDACVRLRAHPRWDLQTRTSATVLRTIAQRARALGIEAATPCQGHPQARTRLAAGPAHPPWGRPDHRSHCAVRLVPPRPDPL
jgi:transposase